MYIIYMYVCETISALFIHMQYQLYSYAHINYYNDAILASYLTSCRDTTRHQTLFTILVMGVVVYISRFKSMVCISEHWIKCIHSTSSIAKVAVTYYTIQACQHAQYIELTQIQPHNKWAEFYTQFRRYVWCIMCTYSLSWYIITDYVCQVFYLKKKLTV